MKGTLRAMAIAAAVGLMAPARAQAWGRDGHIIVARIAEQYLTPKARAAIGDLLDGRSIGESRIANWADLIKGSSYYATRYPKHRLWHYVDIDVAVKEEAFAPLKDKDNVVARIAYFQKVLVTATESKVNRKEALMFLVHFLGDLHQPLHCCERNKDQGGNLVKIGHFRGERGNKLNLHAIWDSDLVRKAMGELEADDYAVRRTGEIKAAERQQWLQGDASKWAWESHQVAVDKAYKFTDGKDLPDDRQPFDLTDDNYVAARVTLIPEQLKKAGVRLARVLNDAFEK